jgi:hypothetical protein
MKAQELRIGNYAIKTRTGEVYPVSANDIANFACSCEMQPMFKPEPLTEDWLLKFGFEFQERGTIKDYLLFNKEGVGELLLSSINGQEWTTYGVKYKIQYVHHLQNLYYSLTGKELEI